MARGEIEQGLGCPALSKLPGLAYKIMAPIEISRDHL